MPSLRPFRFLKPEGLYRQAPKKHNPIHRKTHDACIGTITGVSDRHLDFDRSAIFKLFRGGVFNRPRHFRINAYHFGLIDKPYHQTLSQFATSGIQP